MVRSEWITSAIKFLLAGPVSAGRGQKTDGCLRKTANRVIMVAFRGIGIWPMSGTSNHRLEYPTRLIVPSGHRTWVISGGKVANSVSPVTSRILPFCSSIA